ncbi:MAG: SRPBCC family protein [Terriglobia bacterium]
MENLHRRSTEVNVGPVERFASAVCGGVLLIGGLRRASKQGAVLALIGADFVCRGLTGHSEIYSALGLSSAPRKRPNVSVPYRAGIRVDECVTIHKPPEELYKFWRDFENLPYFMEHLASVTTIDEKRSHWIAKAPRGKHVEWDAEIINDVPGKLIGWRSVGESEIDTAGSVHFSEAPGGRGTEVKVELQYLPPAGPVGAVFAKLFGEEPELQVREDLRHLKQTVEAGEIPTTQGQPMGSQAL